MSSPWVKQLETFIEYTTAVKNCLFAKSNLYNFFKQPFDKGSSCLSTPKVSKGTIQSFFIAKMKWCLDLSVPKPHYYSLISTSASSKSVTEYVGMNFTYESSKVNAY